MRNATSAVDEEREQTVSAADDAPSARRAVFAGSAPSSRSGGSEVVTGGSLTPRLLCRAAEPSRCRAPPRLTSGANSPTISPSYMTRMRSESERISSSSSETSRTARPASRSSTSRRWTNSIAPTSRPRVGCAAIRTRGSRSNSRARIDLLLVPARERAGGRLRAAAANVELLDQPSPRARRSRVGQQPSEARVRRLRRSRAARGSRRA